MASVFKRGRDKGKRGAAWHYEFVDAEGKPRMRKGFTDKGLTQQLANKMESDAKLRREGLIDAVEEAIAERQRSPVKEQLDAFEAAQRTKKNSEKHVKLTMSRIRLVIAGCEWISLGDLNADELEAFMAEYQEDHDIGNRTYNHYLQAVDSFGNWLAHPKRKLVRSNPFAGVDRRNAEIDVRHPRRALTPKEFRLLLSAARKSGFSVQCFTGEERARIYTLSYMTGLRKGEIASLTKGSFVLGGKQPRVTVDAKASKHRKKDVLPLHPELVKLLRDWLADLKRDDVLFPKLAGRKAWKMVKKDLELVGIPYRNEEGFADFHAAGRHTHITELLRNGATLPEAKELARHSTVQMTMKYVHIGIEDQAKALSALPAPWQGIGRDAVVSDGQSVTQSDTTKHEDDTGTNNRSPVKNGASVAGCQPRSANADHDQKRRTRDSNPQPINRQLISNQSASQFAYPPTFWRRLPSPKRYVHL